MIFADPFSFFCGSIYLIYVSYLHLLYCLSVPCSLVGTCCERADLLALSYFVFLCYCHFPIWCHSLCVILDCVDSRSLPSSLLLYLKSPMLEHSLAKQISCQIYAYALFYFDGLFHT